MKFIGRMVVLLLIVDVLLVYMHYRQAETAEAKESATQEYVQEIEVVNRTDGLHIRHHFSNLSAQRYELDWPESAVSRSCHIEDESSCVRLEDGENGFAEGVETSQSLSYMIPKNGPMQQTRLFKDIFATLRGSDVSSTALHFTDETNNGGLWVNGLKRIGSKEMERINYSYFRGSGGVTDLYWQKTELPLVYTGKAFSVYGNGLDPKRFAEVDKALGRLGTEHADVVAGKGNPAIQSGRFTITETRNEAKLADLFLADRMHAIYLIPQKDRLLANLAASIISEQPRGTDRSHQIYATLVNSITEEELDQLSGKLLDMAGKKIDAGVLDRMVGDVTGYRTSYFKKSVRYDGGSPLFLIEDPREIQYEGKSDPTLRIILKDGKTFYSVESILNRMGYTISSNDRSIYIENDMRKFRFPKKELFYVYNERKYDLVSMPFELLEGEIFFEEGPFQRLFLFSIDKTGEAVNLVPISTLIEEAENK